MTMTGQTGQRSRKRGKPMTDTPVTNGGNDELRQKAIEAAETYERIRQSVATANTERDEAIAAVEAANTRLAGAAEELKAAKEWAQFLEQQIAIHSAETKKALEAYYEVKGQLTSIRAVILKQDPVNEPPRASTPEEMIARIGDK